MIVLFDLDDTLLENSMEKFLPAYFHLLGKSLSDYVSPHKLPEIIFSGTELMVNNLNPQKTLEECFNDYFYTKLGRQKNSLIEKITHFYKNEFPALKPITNEIQYAAETINALLQSGHKIIIATNPLFPKLAIDHRVNWANLGVPLSAFTYITNYEELHFTKPHPEFILEILGKIGWPDEQIVMIGNEWDMDIDPAEQLGIPTFFIGSTPKEHENNLNPLSSSGLMKDVVDWVNQINGSEPYEMSKSDIAIKASLRATAANIDSYKRNNLVLKHFSTRPEPNEWSLIEIISHLADVDAEVNIPRLELIRNQENPFIEAALTDQWAEERNYIQRDPHETISSFMENRRKLLSVLSEFDNGLWNKSINHAIFGPTKVSELMKFTTQHDRIHISQIYNTLETIKNNGK